MFNRGATATRFAPVVVIRAIPMTGGKSAVSNPIPRTPKQPNPLIRILPRPTPGKADAEIGVELVRKQNPVQWIRSSFNRTAAGR